ncbi:MAG: HPr family phosphocarrier protein [Oligoflexia bacterium]|nr:HPr family phosphocarrier protein [Oligoflexia bacterium]
MTTPSLPDRGQRTDATTVRVQVVNELGLHLRAAARFVETAARWPCRVVVGTVGPVVDGKSLLALSSLLARQGTLLTITCSGKQHAPAADALRELVAQGFRSGSDST